jgi:hypothetical protein
MAGSASNSTRVQSLGASHLKPPGRPSTGSQCGPSFRDVSSCSCVMQETPTFSIPMPKDVIAQAARLTAKALVCRFNGFWPSLVNFHDWISKSWKSKMKVEDFIHPA